MLLTCTELCPILIATIPMHLYTDTYCNYFVVVWHIEGKREF
jgi:hypothetical protein